MATDIELIIRNIESCYDFTDKSVIHIGAGGGQFIGYATKARSVVAVDPDPEAIARLQAAIRQKGLEDRIRTVTADFLTIQEQADVAFFEFCLHEIDNPDAALAHARALAREVLIADHARDSRWAWYVNETEKADRGWSAVEKLPVKRDVTYTAEHRFRNHDELFAKVASQGEITIDRISAFKDQKDFVIFMDYRVAVIG